MTTKEDFTFPTFSDPSSSGIDSPPLWRLSPSASPCHVSSCHDKSTPTHNDQKHEEDEKEDDNDHEEEFEDCFPLHKPVQRKSFSWVDKGGSKQVGGRCGDEEEKMDMLWEDFNEDLPFKRSHSASKYDYDHGMLNIGCVHQLQSLRFHKASTAVVSPKKSAAPGFVMFVKVLKKLFWVHDSHHPTHRPVSQTNRSRSKRAKNRSR